MTADLYDEDAPAAILFLLSWLAPLDGPDHVGQSRTERDVNTFPFRQVEVLTVSPDEILSVDNALVSVHTFCKASTPAERAAARLAARDTDRRLMLLQDNPMLDVTMPDESIANCEFLDVVERSTLRDYKVDTIHRYVGRFRYGLSYVAV